MDPSTYLLPNLDMSKNCEEQIAGNLIVHSDYTKLQTLEKHHCTVKLMLHFYILTADI